MALQARVQGVLECGAEQRRRQHHPHDREARWQQRPPGTGADRPAVEREVQHLAPADDRRIAEAEEGERRLGQDGEADDENHVGQHQRQHRGQDVPPQDVRVAGADGPRAHDELTLPDAEGLGTHQPCGRGPAQRPDDEDDRAQRGADDRHQHDLQRQVRDDEEEVGDPHQQRADPSAAVAGNDPDETSDDERDGGGREANHQRHARAVEERGEDVLAAVIGPEHVRGRGRLVDVTDVDPHAGVRVVRREQRREDRHQQRDAEHRSADDAHAVAHERPPGTSRRLDRGGRGGLENGRHRLIPRSPEGRASRR